jgi:hypothetical protein
MGTDINFKKHLGRTYGTYISLPAFDPDYSAILNRATALGYTLPSASVQAKQNTLLTSMKADGVWAKLDVFYVFAQDGGADFGTLNWKNPNANQANIASSPTFVSNGGLMGNGTSSFIDTNFNPFTQGVQYTQNNASRYFFTHAISGSGRFDGNAAANRNSMVRGLTNAQRINAGTNISLVALDLNATVNTKSLHRTSATDITAYNSTTGASTTQASAAMDNLNQWILRSAGNYGGHTCAAYAMGAELTAENTSFINTWNTYKSSL